MDHQLRAELPRPHRVLRRGLPLALHARRHPTARCGCGPGSRWSCWRTPAIRRRGVPRRPSGADRPLPFISAKDYAPSRPPTSCGRGRTCTSTSTWAAAPADLRRRHDPRRSAGSTARWPRTPTSPTRARLPAPAGGEHRLPRLPGADVRDAAGWPGSGIDPDQAPFATASAWADYDRPARRCTCPTTTAGTSAPAATATSSTWCGCSSRGRRRRASAAATWTCRRPGSNLPGITDADLGGVLRLGGALRAPLSDAEPRRPRRVARSTRTGPRPATRTVPGDLAALHQPRRRLHPAAAARRRTEARAAADRSRTTPIR